MKTIGIIRQRGQLTIPDSIRKAVKWAEPMSAVSISVGKPDEIVIKPQEAFTDWVRVWDGIREARATKGNTDSMSAAEFLDKDRSTH